MKKYSIALIPGVLLFFAFYFTKNIEINVLLRDLGRVAFLYVVLALAVSPIITLTQKNGFLPYRRTFGVIAFFLASAHTIKFFYDIFAFNGTLFVTKDYLQLDVISGVIAFLIIFILGITSNDCSVKVLRSAWKKIQTFTYPLFIILALHIAFASRFDDFYMILIGALIFLRTIAYIQEKNLPIVKISGESTRYLCVPCGYIYDEKEGDPDGGIAPGTRFEDIPDDWVCPVCGVSKADFIPLGTEESANILAKIISYTHLNHTTLELIFSTDSSVSVIPGQYASIELKDRDGTFVRSYSIVKAIDSRLTFCIKLSSGRSGNALKNLKIGDTVGIKGIYGKFVLNASSSPKIFIATGTGLAPIMNMMRQAPGVQKMLLFGVQTQSELFYTNELQNIPQLTTHIFLSREEVLGFRHGRIDLSIFNFPKESEFYICGNPKMVEENASFLRKAGFEKIYFEKF